MEAEHLIDLIYAGELAPVVDAISPLTAKARKLLATPVSECFKGLADIGLYQTQDSPAAESARTRLRSAGVQEDQLRGAVNRAHQAAEVAMLGCCSFSKIKSSGISLRIGNQDSRDRNYREAVLAVLQDRELDFNNRLVAHCIRPSPESWRGIDWRTLTRLMQSGACDKPEHSEYLMLLTESIGHDHMYARKGGRIELFEEAAAVPDLLTTDIYHIFEYDTDAFAYDWCGWDKLIGHWIETNRVDRNKIFRCALSALANPFRQNTLSGLVQFIEGLEPGLEDWLREEALTFGLLNNSNSSILNFGLKKIKELHKANLLAPAKLVEELAAVFRSPKKGSAKTALSLVQQTGKKHPEVIPAAFATLISALDHPEVDVNEKAIDLIAKWSDRAHLDHATAIREKLPQLPPAIVSKATEVVESIAGSTPETHSRKSNDSTDRQSPSADLTDLHNAASEIAEPWKCLAGILEVQEALNQQTYPTALQFAFQDVPVLSGLSKIEPIQSHEELLDVVASALEGVEDPLDVERILDGIVRLGRFPKSFHDRTQPIAKRLQKIPTTEFSKGLTTAVDSAHTLQLLEWLFELPASKESDFEYQFPSYLVELGITSWFKDRIDEILKLTGSASVPGLLSLPTHERGWIDPIVFVERLARHLDQPDSIGAQDFAIALLRLAPEHRDVAITQLPDKASPWLWMAKMALGVDIQQLQDLSDCDLGLLSLAAAVRCTDVAPIGDEAGKRIGFSRRIAHGEPVVWAVNWAERILEHQKIQLAMTKPLDCDPVIKPLIELVQLKENSRTFSVWRTHLNLSLSQNWAAPFLMLGIERLTALINDNSTSSYPVHAYFEIFFEPDQCWSPLHYFLLALGSLAKNLDVRLQVTDALIEGTEEGKSDPGEFGYCASVAIKSGIGVPKRLADLFAEIARNSDLHHWFTTLALDKLIAELGADEKLPRGSDKILEVYLNGAVDLELQPSSEMMDVLRAQKGASKTAKLAKKIVALKPREESPKRKQALISSLSARIERAKRWQSATSTSSTN